MNRTQERLKEALMLAGVSEKEADNKVACFIGSHHCPQAAQLCPRCGGRMKDVQLMNGRKAMFCANDRVVVPYPVENVNSGQAYENYMKVISQPSPNYQSIFA